MSRPQDDRNQEATVYLGNLDERCSDALIWELMLQAGPVVNVHLPKDRISMAHQGYGFCELLTEEDAEYACKIMNQIKLWGKPIRVNKASSDKKQLDVGANLFIGNLDEAVDERVLYDTFSTFGMMATTAKIARDPGSGLSKGYGFVSYTDFESSDAAIESMNGQFLMNKAISVQYAFKKDGKGERHGTPAERLLAAQARKNNALPVSARPPPAPMGIFGAVPPTTPGVPGGVPPGVPVGGQVAPGVPTIPGGVPTVPGSIRPPPPPGVVGPGFQGGPYHQGQFAGALSAAGGVGQPPPPLGFTPQQTIVPQAVPMQMGGMPPPPSSMSGPPGVVGIPVAAMPPPPQPPPGMQVFNPGVGGFPPPPPPGFGAVPGMPMMPPPPPGGPPQSYMPM